MLSIPSAVEALFKTDLTRKNFRVHFPNGEMNDITNDNVLIETVKFTESLCSQDVLRFGLTEASMIEFESVGVANMYGMTIECGIEIDTTSLTAAQISAIQAGTWDGTLVLAADSDLGWGYFRIPYGTFRVDSCPRNQQAMTHRRVKAYSIGVESKYSANPFELAKLALLLPGSNGTYNPNAKCLFYSALAYRDAGLMAAAGYTKTQITPGTAGYFGSTYSLKLTDSTTISMTADGYRQTAGSGGTATTMFAIDTHGYDYAGMLQGFVDFLEGLNVDPVASGYPDMVTLAKTMVGPGFAPCVEYSYTVNGTSYGNIGLASILYSNEAVCPYLPGLGYQISIPNSVELMTTIGGVYHSKGYTIPSGSYATVYSLTDTAAATALDTMAIAFPATLQQSRTISGTSFKCWSFVDAVPLLDYVNGYLELLGRFGKVSRAGGAELLSLSSASPVAIGPGDTEELWWDEYDVQPVGSVTYSFGNGEASELVFGTGRSVYDLTDNAALKALTGATKAGVEALLAAALIPALSAVAYTPVELSIRALPWIEAGDALQITAEDSTVVDTFALNHVISGIQALFDDIEAKGGELVDSWEE